MAANAVRELITKIKFLTDNSGLEAAKKKVEDLKKNISKVDKAKIKINVDTSKIDAAREKMEALGSKLTSGGMALSAAGAGMLGAVGLPVGIAANFEATMSKVKAITGSTDAEMQKLTKTARQLGRDTVFSASEAGEAMTYLGMAGWKTEQIIAGMPGLLDLAAASGGDLARTADIISDDLTAFGLRAEEAGHMADVFAAASMNANTNVELMGYTFKYVGAVCGALGYSIEDAALATGLLANAGIKGEQAGTYLRAVITRLVSPTKEAATAMEELGISAANTDGTMKPLRQVLTELRSKFAGLTKEQQAQAAESLAGKEAMTGLLSLVNATEADFNKLAGAIDNSNGAAKTFAETSKKNLKGSLKELQSAMEDVAIEIGNSLLPDLDRLTKLVKGATKWIGEFAAKHPVLVKGIMGTVAALGALFVGLGTIGIFVGGLMQLGAVFAGIASSIAPIVAGFGGLLPFLGVIAVAFGLIAAAISFVQDNWTKVYEWIYPGLVDIQEGVKEFGKAWQDLTPIIEMIKPILYDLIQIIGGVIVRMLINLFNVGAMVFKGIAKFVSWLAEKLLDLIGPISTVANGIAGLISGAREFLGLKGGMSYDAMHSSSTGEDFERGFDSITSDAQRAALRSGNNTVNVENNFSNVPPEQQGNVAADAVDETIWDG